MDDLISRQAAIETVRKAKSIGQAHRMLVQLPPAQLEHLCTVMERIKEKYAKAMNTPCIHNPMAWALYQVWKEYDNEG